MEGKNPGVSKMNEYLGYKVIEDESVTELRLPKNVVDYLKNIENIMGIEYIFVKEIKKQKFSGVIYVSKSLIGKKAFIIILK